MALRLAKLFLLLLVGISIGLLWIYCHGFLPVELISHGAVPSTAERAAGIATLIVLFAAPALPIYRLFPDHALLAAALVGWVPLALAVMLAVQADVVIPRRFAVSVPFAEGVACWATVVLGDWTTRSLLKQRSQNSV